MASSFEKTDFDGSMNLSDQDKLGVIPNDLSRLSPLFASSDVVVKRGLLFKNLFETVFSQQSDNLMQNKIPKIIHHIWIGGNLPDNFKFCIESCRRHHPDWEHRLWTDADLKKYNWRFKDVLLSKKINPGKKSDILRLEILHKYGGVYLDTDFYCCKSLAKLHEKVDFYCCIVDEYFSINNAIIGCTAGNKLIEQCLEMLQPNEDNSSVGVLLNTGPYFFTEQVVKYLNNNINANIVVLPRSYFHAMPASHRFDFWNGSKNLTFIKQFEKTESLAIHLWATSWQENSKSKNSTIYNVLKRHNILFTNSLKPHELICSRRISDGATPLIAAVQGNLVQVVDLLGRNGADFKLKDFSDHDALYYAKQQNNLELIKLIDAYTN